MIVGTKNVPLDELRENATSVERLIRFSDNLVPRILRHDKRITDNQRYLVALLLRNITSIQFYKRQELAEELVKDIKITGVSNLLFDYEDLLMNSNIPKLQKYIMDNQR